jgi:hypothetical protein
VLVGERAVGMAAVTLKKSTGLNRESLVQNVALNMAGRAQQNLSCPNAALDAATDRDLVRKYFALDDGFFPDHETSAVHVAFNATIHLHISGGRKRAGDDKIRAYD